LSMTSPLETALSECSAFIAAHRYLLDADTADNQCTITAWDAVGEAPTPWFTGNPRIVWLIGLRNEPTRRPRGYETKETFRHAVILFEEGFIFDLSIKQLEPWRQPPRVYSALADAANDWLAWIDSPYHDGNPGTRFPR
jgi:hypothetical protein